MKKRKRYLSLIIVPHHKGSQQVLEFSYSTLRWLAAAGAFLLVLVLILVLNYGHIYWRAGQYELMRKRQQDMEAEFAKLGQLKSEIARLHSVEDKLRAMLGYSQQSESLAVNDISRRAETVGATAAAGSRGPAAARPDSLHGYSPSIKPVKGWISAGLTAVHQGVDIAAREGEPVMAAADGIVTFAGWDTYFGNRIEISHGARLSSMYGHNAKILVKQGDRVRQGQVIALVGSTGKSSGPHLHYEVRVNGKSVDPTTYWVSQ